MRAWESHLIQDVQIQTLVLRLVAPYTLLALVVVQDFTDVLDHKVPADKRRRLRRQLQTVALVAGPKPCTTEIYLHIHKKSART